MFEILFSRQAGKDAKKLSRCHLEKSAQELLAILASDPFQTPPRYETLCGDLSGCYSRRINLQHRIGYEVFDAKRAVLVLRMWSHHGE
jgi:toxin YoeB